jgi:hypothetical protein
MLRRGFRSSLACVCASSAKCWMNNSYQVVRRAGPQTTDRGRGRLTAAHVMMNAALLEHIWTSESWEMIFLTLDTGLAR